MGLAVQVSMSGRRQSGKCKWPPRRRVQDEGAHIPPVDPPQSPTPDQKIAAPQPPTQWPLRSSPLSRCSQCSARHLRPRRCQRTARCRTQAPAMKIPTAYPSATSGTRSAAVNTGARIVTVASRSTGMRSEARSSRCARPTTRTKSSIVTPRCYFKYKKCCCKPEYCYRHRRTYQCGWKEHRCYGEKKVDWSEGRGRHFSSGSGRLPVPDIGGKGAEEPSPGEDQTGRR
jgi:hypothetical protein